MENVETRCITQCPRGFHFCCRDCWILNCKDDCGSDVYDHCKLSRTTPDLTREDIFTEDPITEGERETW